MARLGDMPCRFVLSHECPYLKIEIWAPDLWRAVRCGPRGLSGHDGGWGLTWILLSDEPGRKGWKDLVIPASSGSFDCADHDGAVIRSAQDDGLGLDRED